MNGVQRLFKSTMTRLAVMMLASHLILMGIVLTYLFIVSQHQLIAEEKALVAEAHSNLIDTYSATGTAGLALKIQDRQAQFASNSGVYLLENNDGEALAGNIEEWPDAVAENTRWAISTVTLADSGQSQNAGLQATALSDGARLVSGQLLAANEQLDNALWSAMIAAFLIGLPAAFMITSIKMNIISRRVSKIADVTDAVRAGDLSKRIPVEGREGRFDQLFIDINAMLDDQEQLVTQLRLVTDGLAHDLRSPIARLKTAIEQARLDMRDQDAVLALERATHESDTLLAMLATALQINRASAGVGKDKFAPTNVAVMLADMVEVYGPLCEERGIEITCSSGEELIIPLHRELVSQALSNLIDNALKYATGATKIRLMAKEKPEKFLLIVEDNGVGIPVEQRSAALRRFSRLDNSRNMPGAGLGLSLVHAVAKLHGGTVKLLDAEPGLRVEFQLAT